MNNEQLNLFEYLSDTESQLITGGAEDSMFIFIVDGESSYSKTAGNGNQTISLKRFPPAHRLVSLGILEPLMIPQ